MMMETESLRRHCHIDQFSEDLSLISCLAPILPTLDPHSLGVGGGGGKKKKSSAVLFCSRSGIPQLMFVFIIDFLSV